MIQELQLFWELFAHSFLTTCLLAWLLAQIGVFVVARDQIFLGAAVSQASTLGIAATLSLAAFLGAESWANSRAFSSIVAVLFSVVAAIVSSRPARRESRGAITGWVFLAAGSLAILVVTGSPHAQEHVHRLLFSSLVVARNIDVWLFAILALISTGFLTLRRDEALLFTLDPAMATSVGMHTKSWSFLTAAWLGMTIGLAIGASGLLFAFGCLVLPALIAKNFLGEFRPVLLLAPAISLLVAATSFIIAHHLDYPPGQLTAAVLALFVLLAWGVAWLRRR